MTYEEWLSTVPEDSNLALLAASGARVTAVQIDAMLLGNREVTTPTGDAVIERTFKQGLDQRDMMICASAGRMSLASNVQVVPDSGYLYRQIVSVLHDITITAPSCENDDDVGKGGIIDNYGPIRPCDVPPDLSTGRPHPVGCKLGLITAQTISERLTQAALSQKHASGSKTHGTIGMLDKTASPLTMFKRVLSNVDPWRREIVWYDEEKSRTHFGDMLSLAESYRRFKYFTDQIVKIDELHLMVLFRGMTEVLENGKLRSDGDHEIQADPVCCGLTMLPLKYNRLLKSLRYGYTARSMQNALMQGQTEEFLDSERVIIGMLPKTIQKERGF